MFLAVVNARRKYLGAALPLPVTNPHAVSALAKLVSWWEMTEASGTRYDSYGPNHLDYVGPGSFSVLSGVPGSGGGVQLLTTDAYLARAGTDCVGLDDASTYEFFAWVSSGNIPGSLWTVFSKVEAGVFPTRGYIVYIGRNDTDPNKIKHVKGSFGVDDPVAEPFPIDTWVFVSAYRDGTDRGIAMDAGAEIVTETGATTSNSTADAFVVGPRHTFNNMTGTKVGQMARFNAKLTDDERTYFLNGGAGVTFAQFASDAGL